MAMRWLLMVLPFALWGSSMAAMKLVMPHSDPLTVGCLRILPAALLLFAVQLLLRRPLGVALDSWGWLLLFSLVDGTLAQGLLVLGLEHTGAGLGSVLIDTQPLLVALYARTLFSERINPIGWSGLLLGVVGVLCLGLPSGLLEQLGNGSAEAVPLHWSGGEPLMLGSALCMASGTVLCRFAAQESDPLAVTAWHLLIGGLPLLLVDLLQGGSVTALASGDWWLMAYVALGGTALGYGLFFWFANRVELTGFTALSFLTPVFALLCGLLLQEQLAPLQWLGVALVLTSTVLIGQRQHLWREEDQGLRVFDRFFRRFAPVSAALPSDRTSGTDH